MNHCPHGIEYDLRVPEGFACTEPIYRCACCGSDFWFIEMAMWPWVVDGLAYMKWNMYEPKDKCRGCGGKMVERLERREDLDEKKPPTLMERLAKYKQRKHNG